MKSFLNNFKPTYEVALKRVKIMHSSFVLIFNVGLAILW